MKAAFFILFLPVILALQSDDRERYSNDFRLIQQAYKKQANLQFSTLVRDFKEGKNPHCDTVSSCTYYFKGKSFYYKANTTEVLKNDQYLISVDHYKKAIVIYKSSDFKDDFMPVNMVDSFMNKNTVALKYSEKQNGKTACYTMNIMKSNKPFNKMEMEFDNSTYFVNRIRLFITPGKLTDAEGKAIDTGNQIEYVFGGYKLGNLDDKIFATTRFVNITGNQFKAATAYKDFKIIALIPVQQQSK